MSLLTINTNAICSNIFKILNKKEMDKLMNNNNQCDVNNKNHCHDGETIDSYGQKLENNCIIMVDSHGKLIESHSGMCLARNGKELDLLIAWMETLRKQMPE
ncbi:hypothetical protein ACU63Y_24460 [Klebsiella aerogenes]